MSKGLTKILYIVVKDGDTAEMEKNDAPSFRYTRSVLQSTLQLIGCKSRHAFKISKRVFEMVREGTSLEKLDTCAAFSRKDVEVYNHEEIDFNVDAYLSKSQTDEDKSQSKPFELYKRRTTVVVQRNVFLDVVCEALSEYKYVGPNQRADLVIACRIRERKESVTVLLCGTSGCGKSTLSALLGSRLGITTIVSTDSIRHMMRSFVDEKQNPLLWSSTYHAGEHLDPIAVAEAKAKRKAKKPAGVSTSSLAKNTTPNNSVAENSEVSSASGDLISGKQMAVEGFKAQSEMVIDSLDRLIIAWEERKESVVVEGVHLSLNFVMSLMKKHPSIIPFMIYISNEDKHLERFAVRAKYMTLDPAKNKYVKYIRNIRAIQEYLCNRADKHLVPKINNTNVDKSVAVIHATVFSCLRRRVMGEQLYDPLTNTVEIVHEEYRNHRTAYSLSSKGMFQLIQRHGSSRQLMALLNNDGSVAKAWPVNGIDDTDNPGPGNTLRNEIGSPMYGPLQIGKAEPINLQFGCFGISSWPFKMGGTSRGSSVDGSRGDTTENSSRSQSSGCSSPYGPSKELMEELSVHGSDDEEEVDDHPEVDSDEDLIDREKNVQEELEGSVDEEYTKSDEEYDDLAMQDFPTGRMSEDDQECFYKIQLNAVLSNEKGLHEDKYLQNLDRFLRTKHDPLAESLLCSFASPMKQKAERSATDPHPMACNLRKRSQSIPSFGKHGALINVPNQ